MAKRVINSFNAGELSPYLYARTDLDKYGSGCLVMENFTPLPYGGAIRRPALEYIGASKQDDKIRLIPFTFNTAGSYILELGEKYIRFYKDGAIVENLGIPVEVGSPYIADDLAELKWAQSADVLWLAHPNYPIQRLSRFSDTSWTITPENFDYPPLREENDTDITMSPSAVNGEIILTSSQDFFNEGHVGSYMAFDAIRDTDNKSNQDGNVTGYGFSDGINVSSSDWEFTTTGSWRAKIILQKSTDNKKTWEDYIDVCDTIGFVSAAEGRNFSLSSDEPEPYGTWLRVRYIAATDGLNYELQANDPYLNSLIKITSYIDEKNVSAEVISDFQDTISDYPEHSSSTSYSKGDKVRINVSIDYTSTSVDLTSINSGLTDITGSDFGGGYFWFVTNGASNKKIWKLNSGLTAVESGFPIDISSDFGSVADIAFYGTNLYVLGSAGSGDHRVRKYTLAGSYVSDVFNNTDYYLVSTGLGYHNDNFYISSYTTAGLIWTVTEKYTTGFIHTGNYFFSVGASKAMDSTGVENNIFLVNDTDNSIDVSIDGYNPSLQFDISTETTNPQGISYDGDNLWIVSGSGITYKYDVIFKTSYYEYVHTSADTDVFSVQYSEGRWAERTPVMTTWSEGAFSDYRGHPQAIALFENRLCYAGTDSDPNTIWLSAIDDYSNFRLGDLDIDGMKLTLNSGRIDEIRWMVPQSHLVIGTAGAEWSLGPASDQKPVTPTGFDIKRRTTYGSNNVQGILVNSAILFLMRQSRKVREWTLQFEAQDYVAPDLSILAEHITEGGVSSLDFQQQPDNILWGIRADGTLLGFTYERDQNVTGWHRQSNNKFIFESLAVIPRDNEEDEVWLSVKITVDGNIKRYICRMNDRGWGTDYKTEWQGSDLYKTYSSPGTATLAGLDYLEGLEVCVVADGTILDNETISGGEITINSDSYDYVVVGLPFTSTLAPIYLESQGQFGTTQGTKKDVRTGTVRFKDTFSAKVGQKTSALDNVRFDQDLTPLHNGDTEVHFDNESEFIHTCYIVQEDPMPCTVLAMVPHLEGRR